MRKGLILARLITVLAIVAAGPGASAQFNLLDGMSKLVHQELRYHGSGLADALNDGDTVVWETSDGDTVVWGTRGTDPRCEPIVWNRP